MKCEKPDNVALRGMIEPRSGREKGVELTFQL